MDPLDSISNILTVLSEIAGVAPQIIPVLEDFIGAIGSAVKDRKVSLSESLALGAKGFSLVSAVVKAVKALEVRR